MADSPPPVFRWQAYFQRAAEPLFVLGRRRRVRFVNAAWTRLTGMTPEQVRGQACPRRAAGSAGPWTVLEALHPPPELSEGGTARVQRLVAVADGGRQVWQIHFLPLRDEHGLLCTLGKIASRPAETASELPLAPEQLLTLQDRVAGRYRLDDLDSEVPAMHRVADQVRLAAQTATPVVILGEPGTGKHWLARLIHHHGPARDGHFLAVDGGRLPPAALAGLLSAPGGLVHQRGAGTVYLREPDRLPRDLQAGLAALLASGGRPRLIAGFTADPAERVHAGQLLDDVYCKLSTLVIALPALRDRAADLPRLVERLLERLAGRTGRRPAGLAPAAWDAVRAYPWPGNLRELYQLLAAAGRRATGERIEAGDLPAYLRLAVRLGQPPETPARSLPLDALLEEAERRLILLALRTVGGNKSRAAELLAVWRPRLLRRMEALGIGGGSAAEARAPAEEELEIEEVLDDAPPSDPV
jgi:transcriptional regulator with PAS, ATPase and Fis domain